MLTKVEIIVDYIEQSIKNKELSNGDQIPSLTKIMETYNVSRDTVIRAYKELNARGIIGAIHGKGYFVKSDTINYKINLLLLLDELSSYKNILVKSIERELKNKGQYQIFFHHYNAKMFQRIINENKGQFTHYAISPFPGSKEVEEAIETLPKGTLILLDRNDGIAVDTKFVGQLFVQDIMNCLNQLKDRIKKYNRFVFVFPEPSFHPVELKFGFEKYCKSQNIEWLIISDIEILKINRHDCYLVIDNNDLTVVVKYAQKQGWDLGKDIGLVSYNETSLKALVSGGITTISTDFNHMGKNLVKMLFESKINFIHNDVNLILRNSF